MAISDEEARHRAIEQIRELKSLMEADPFLSGNGRVYLKDDAGFEIKDPSGLDFDHLGEMTCLMCYKSSQPVNPQIPQPFSIGVLVMVKRKRIEAGEKVFYGSIPATPSHGPDHWFTFDEFAEELRRELRSHPCT